MSCALQSTACDIFFLFFTLVGILPMHDMMWPWPLGLFRNAYRLYPETAGYCPWSIAEALTSRLRLCTSMTDVLWPTFYDRVGPRAAPSGRGSRPMHPEDRGLWPIVYCV